MTSTQPPVRVGAGALPFRGHVTLEGLDGVLETFPGLRTVALRYDHGEEATRAVVTRLREQLGTGAVAGPDSATRSPASGPPAFTPAELDQLYNFIAIFTRHYLETFPCLANKTPPTGTPLSLAGSEFPVRSRPGPGRAQPPPR